MLSETSDVLIRLLAASVVRSVVLHKRSPRDDALIDAATLSDLMEQCQSLKALRLQNLEMDENHYRVLGPYSRPGLQIVYLIRCELTISGTSASFLWTQSGIDQA